MTTEVSDLITNIVVGNDDLLRLHSAVNDPAGTYVDANGDVVKNLRQRLNEVGYDVPIAFAAGINVTSPTQTVVRDGRIYAANPSSVPFVTTSSFDDAQWLLTLESPNFDTVSDFVNATSTYPDGTQVNVPSIGAIYVATSGSGDVTNASGQSFNVVTGRLQAVTPRMFGASGDGVADDRLAIQAAWDYAAANNVPCDMEGLEYNCSEMVNTRSNLNVWGNWATMYPTGWPAVGGFVNNVVHGDVNERVQSNIYISCLVLDGSKLEAPVSQNSNLLGFARGASNVRIVNCIARKMRDGDGGGTGGGGFGVEQGGENIEFDGCTVEDCYRGFRVAGVPGEFTDDAGQSKRAVNIRVRNLTVRRCGTAVLAHSIGHEGDDQSDLSVFDCSIDGLYIEDCGHYAWREHTYANIPNQKAGAITLAGAQNVRFRNVRVKLNSGYPQLFTDWLGRTGYPTSGDYIGAGLSGKIGAIVWGWGRNVVFEDITIDGSFECVWKCARAITFGDLATVSPTDGATGTVSQVVFENVRYVRPGTHDYVFDGQAGLDNARVSALIKMTPSSQPALGVVGPNGTAGLTNVRINFASNNGNTETGTVPEWLAANNERPQTSEQSFSFGGYDVGGGYSPDGSSTGQSYDDVSGILRSSQNVTSTKFHHAFYNPNGLVGGVTTSGSSSTFATASDARLKSDLREFDGLGMIGNVNVYDFAWVNGGRGLGVMAQELREVVPEAVIAGDEDYEWNSKGESDRVPWSVDYSKLVPLLVKAVQQLSARVEKLENER